MENENIKILISAFVALIIGVSLVGIIANTGNEITNTINISAETIDFSTSRNITAAGSITQINSYALANVPTTWRITGCPIAGLVLYNTTNSLALNTDYTFVASTGLVTFLNTTDTMNSLVNTTTATYQYCDSEYITQGWQRTILNLVPGFFALALMGVGIGLFFAIGRKEGVW